MSTQSAGPVAGPSSPAWKRVALEIGQLLVIAVLITTVFAVAGGLGPKLILFGFLHILVITTSFGLVISGLYDHVFPRLSGRARGLLATAGLHALLMGGGSLVATEIAIRCVHLLGGPPPAAMRARVLLIGLLVSLVVVGLHFAHERLRVRAREAELRARLESLRARTNPHFFFNSLNAVAGLIAEDAPKAERLIEKLAGVYRHALERADAEWIRLGDELEAIRAYLEIEEARLEGRLEVELDCDEGVDSVLIPPMSLQPLVENAVLHGVAGRSEPGRVRIEIRKRPGRLLVSVEDDGPGPGRSVHRGTGTALATLRERLALSHGGRARLELGPRADGTGCRASLELPIGELRPGDLPIGELPPEDLPIGELRPGDLPPDELPVGGGGRRA